MVSGIGTILLVDDEEYVRIIGQSMLEEMGYDVIIAEDGQQAVELFENIHTDIDLIILDMIMPKMNGSETFYKLKEIDEDCKVIIASGYIKDEKLYELREAGLAGFIKKPYDSYELSQMIANVIESSKAAHLV